MTWTLAALLGAYHGANPAMGWLFAVALGLQRRRASGVVRALPPIALGHAASVLVAVVAIAGLGMIVPPRALRLGGAAVLCAFATLLLLRRRSHPRWMGMRLGFAGLTVWSFLMSSAHGAGLMLLPLLLPDSRSEAHAEHLGSGAIEGGVIALLAHTAGMFAVMTVIALVVYRVLGVDFLRRAWINFDLFWIGAIYAAALATAVAR